MPRNRNDETNVHGGSPRRTGHQNPSRSQHPPRSPRRCCREAAAREERVARNRTPENQLERAHRNERRDRPTNQDRRRPERSHEQEIKKHKKSFSSKIVRAGKIVSGVLIVMGIIFVFYAITATIIDGSSAVDLLYDGPTFPYNDTGLIEREEPSTPPENATEVLKSDSFSSHDTDAVGPEGRSYIAYIPVPLNDEEDESEDYEYEEEKKTKERANHKPEKEKPKDPLLVPVMIMPGGQQQQASSRQGPPLQNNPIQPPQTRSPNHNFARLRQRPYERTFRLSELRRRQGNVPTRSSKYNGDIQRQFERSPLYNRPKLTPVDDYIREIPRRNPYDRNPASSRVRNYRSRVPTSRRNYPSQRRERYNGYPYTQRTDPRQYQGRRSNYEETMTRRRYHERLPNNYQRYRNSGARSPYEPLPYRNNYQNRRPPKDDLLADFSNHRNVRGRGSYPRKRTSRPYGSSPSSSRYNPLRSPRIREKRRGRTPGKSKYVPPEQFRYPPSSKSIQDIINYLEEKEYRKGGFGREQKRNFESSIMDEIPKGFFVGDQDHVLDHKDFEPTDINDNNFDSIRYQENYNKPYDDNHFVDDLGYISGNEDQGYTINDDGTFDSKHKRPGSTIFLNENTFLLDDNHNKDNVDINSYNFNDGKFFNSDTDHLNNNDPYYDTPKYEGLPIQTDTYDNNNIPPVQNTNYNSNSPQYVLSKSKPMTIMLDVYPKEDFSSTGDNRFQTLLSLGDQNSQNDYGNGRSNQHTRLEEYEMNKHEIVLHLNIYAKKPTRGHSTMSRSSSTYGNRESTGSGPGAGTLSLELPLLAGLTPLDIYKALISHARNSPRAAAYTLNPHADDGGNKDNVEIELFDVEEGRHLYNAIEEGLFKLNNFLPEDKRISFDGEPVTKETFYEIGNPKSVNQTTSRDMADYPYFFNHNHDYYDYYDHHSLQETREHVTKTVSTAEITPPQTTSTVLIGMTESQVPTRPSTPSISTTPVTDPEQLPTPCWNKEES